MDQPIIKICLGTLGFILLYGALFVYKDDQEKIQNKLIDTWKNIKERQLSFSRLKVYLLVVSEKIIHVTNRLFESKKLGVRLVGGIGVFSILSFFSISPIVFINHEFREITKWNALSFFLLFGFTIFLWFNQRKFLPLIVYIVLASAVISLETYYGTFGILIGTLCFLLFALFFSLALYKLMIYGFGTVVPAAINGEQRVKFILLFLSGLLALCLVWFAVYCFIITKIDLDFIHGLDFPIMGGLLKVIYLFAMFFFTLLLPVIMFVVYILIFAIILLNFLFWSLSKGLFRFLFEHELIKNRKILALAGVICLGVAFPGSPAVVQLGKFFEKVF